MDRIRLLALMILFGLTTASIAPAADLDATHVETHAIKLDLGANGKLLTMAMAADGNLLLGVSALKGSAKKASSDADEQLTRQQQLERMKQQRRQSFQRNQPSRDPRQRRGGPTIPPGSRGYGPGSDRILADPNEDNYEYALLVVNPEGTVIATWEMADGLAPKMIHGHADGSVYVGGHGKLAIFNAQGKLVKMIDTDEVYGAKALTSGMTVNDKYVFVAFGTGNSLRATEDIFRFDRDLTNPKKIVERQYGCCAHLDLDTAGDELLIAENSRHRVNRFDFDGKPIGTWGKRDRVSIEGFAACCNPVCFDFGPGGVLYTAESGIGRVKRYSPTGEYLGMVGEVDTTEFDRGSRLAAASCYIPVEVSPDGRRVYIMDVVAHIVRVMTIKADVQSQ